MFRRKSAAQLTYLTSLTAEFYSACSFKIADFFSSSCFQEPGCKVRKLLNFRIHWILEFKESLQCTSTMYIYICMYLSLFTFQSPFLKVLYTSYYCFRLRTLRCSFTFVNSATRDSSSLYYLYLPL